MSNETPKAARKKIASALKQLPRALWLFLAIGFFSLLAILSLVIVNRSQPVKCGIALPIQETGRAGFADSRTPYECVTFEIFNTNEARTKGLSGRDRLAVNRGALFVFDQPGTECIWMKDMKFALDIVWLDADKKITKIAKGVQPDTYPQSFCKDNTKYVIELNNGTAINARLQVGQQLQL